MASELESVWNSPESDVRLKKRIVRTLIQEIVVDVDGEAGELILIVHWKGGVHTEMRIPRRRRGQNGSQTSKDTVDAVKVLARICSDDWIAAALNRSNLRTGRGNYWTKERVVSLRTYYEIPCYDAKRSEEAGKDEEDLKPNGVDSKEVDRRELRNVIIKERPPSLGWWFGPSDHVLGN